MLQLQAAHPAQSAQLVRIAQQRTLHHKLAALDTSLIRVRLPAHLAQAQTDLQFTNPDLDKAVARFAQQEVTAQAFQPPRNLALLDRFRVKDKPLALPAQRSQLSEA